MKPWTPEDDKIMRDNAGRISDAEIGKLVGHARETVARHRSCAGLPAYHPDRRTWTRRERLLSDAAGLPDEVIMYLKEQTTTGKSEADRPAKAEASTEAPLPEIEITPEMIEAGEAAYLECSPDYFTAAEAAESIFLAMARARLSSSK